MKVVTIRLEGTSDVVSFDCRGRSKDLCGGCRLRFKCLSEKNQVMIPTSIIKKHKINDLRSMVVYMFSEGKISYSIEEHECNSTGAKKLIMKIKK